MGLFSGKPDVAKLQQRGDAKGLARAMRDSDPQVRRSAALALGGLERPEAVTPLCEHLTRDEDGYVRSACARSLERLRSALAVDCLLWSLAYDPDSFVQKCAASALGVIGDSRAVPDLVKALRSPKEARRTGEEAMALDVRQAAAKALGRINSAESRHALAQAQGGGVKGVSDAATQALIPKVVGESHYQTALAAIVAGSRREDEDDGAVRAVCELVPEPENVYDPNAVAVRVSGHTVGYLERSDAARYQQRLIGLTRPHTCRVEIRGGRGVDDSGRAAMYGVFLLSHIELDGPWSPLPPRPQAI